MTTTDPSAGHLPTLEQVAELAGVSRATASRAINGGQRVSPQAQAAVDAAVRRLGYQPNRAARSLVTRRTNSMAVVVPEPDERVFTDPFFAGTLRGVSRVLDAADQQLVLLIARPGHSRDRTVRYLSSRHVDGAIVTSHHREDRLAERLAEIGLPCVFVGRPQIGADQVTYVDVDNEAGGRMATELLIERGCRRIGTVAGPADMAAAVDRLEGWRQALRAAGLPDDAWVHDDFTEPGGEAATRGLLARHPDLDGLFAASDLMAVGALKALGDAGRRVPDDLALVGYDNFQVAERATPPLTTMHNPIIEMAERAASMLLEQIERGGPGEPMRVVYPARLVRRESA